jgi:uncharacterized protein YbaP (TraB family)
MIRTCASALLAMCLALIPVATLASTPMQSPVVVAHPALWTLHSGRATVYLLGSIHILPATYQWRSAPISEAVERAEVFVFEVANNAETQTRVQGLIKQKGYLPAGTSLHSLLSPAARSQLDDVLKQLHMQASSVDDKRPWLASLLIVFAQIGANNTGPESGVDETLMREAAARHRDIRYLESIDQQIALIAPDNPKLEVEEFEGDLKDEQHEEGDWPELLTAWSAADTEKIDKIVNSEFADHPDARKAILDDRNRAFLKQIEAMATEDKTFLVTVGVGHLVGPNSLPALLRGDGFKVDGP